LSSTGTAAIPINNPQGVVAIVVRETLPGLVLTAAALSQVPPVRAQSRTELVGEVVLRGSGGTPGSSVTTNFVAALNAAPAAIATAPPVLQVEGQSQFNGVVQGTAVAFQNVKFTVPAAGAAPLTLRINNVRVDTNTVQNPPDITMNLSASGADPVTIANPSVVVARLAEATLRNGRIFLTQLNAAGARVSVSLPNPVTLQFQPDGSLVRPITDAMARNIIAARDRIGPVGLVELVTREATPGPDAPRRLSAVMADLTGRQIAGPNVRTRIVPVTQATLALLPSGAETLDDIVIVELSPLI